MSHPYHLKSYHHFAINLLFTGLNAGWTEVARMICARKNNGSVTTDQIKGDPQFFLEFHTGIKLVVVLGLFGAVFSCLGLQLYHCCKKEEVDEAEESAREYNANVAITTLACCIGYTVAWAYTDNQLIRQGAQVALGLLLGNVINVFGLKRGIIQKLCFFKKPENDIEAGGPGSPLLPTSKQPRVQAVDGTPIVSHLDGVTGRERGRSGILSVY